MTNLLLIVFSLLVGHVLFLACHLIINHRSSGNLLLGIALVLYAGRVGKSVLTLAFPSESLWLSTFGLVCMAALGPVLYLYSHQLFASGRTFTRRTLFHFVPALLCCFGWSWRIVNPAYYAITLHLLIYLVAATRYLCVHREMFRSDNIRWKWSQGVILASLVIWILFVAQIMVYSSLLYGMVVATSVVSVYGLSLWASRQNNLFTGGFKKRTEETGRPLTELYEKIKKLMEEDEIFIDPSLSLSLLATKLGVPPYVTSKCVNSYFHKSFPELLISYRIEKSKQLLLSSMNKTYSIEGIAYECGFSTLSAFYHAFKKLNGVTPSQFRKNADAGNMKVA